MKQPPFPNQPPRYVGPRRTDRRRTRGIDRLRDLIDRATAEHVNPGTDDELDAAFIAAMAEDHDDEGKS